MADITLDMEELEGLALALHPLLAVRWREDIDSAWEHRNERRLTSNADADARDLLTWLSDHGILKDDFGDWDEPQLDDLYRSWRDAEHGGGGALSRSH